MPAAMTHHPGGGPTRERAHNRRIVMPSLRNLSIRLAPFALLAACSDPPPTPVDATVPIAVDCSVPTQADGAATPTFTEVRAFFTRRCAAGAACHGPGGRGDLVLTGDNIYTDLVGRRALAYPSIERVTAGHPERSFLWLKINGCYRQLPGCSEMGGPCGDPMPTLSPISEGFELSEATLVYAWIAAGAPR